MRDPGYDAMIARLRQAGLRPTYQRIGLAKLLFCNGHRHLTAEMLHGEAVAKGVEVSSATIYNTLHQFTRVGLLLQVVVNPARRYFDTNTVPHSHFYCEDDDMLIDILDPKIAVANMPTSPSGTQIERADVVVYLRRR
ncbi:MAG: transcriptional repressor [Alphaproteobacteria bacterium]|nr:transcriptional repressor [Alphaproteobacteria bacterium]